LKTYGLIGYPLKNAFSASYFNQKFKTLGIAAQYENFPLEHIGSFSDIINRHPEIAGLNVTIPYKEAVIPYLDQLDVTAEQVGAVNTIRFHNNRLTGYNTDIYGFEKSILPQLKAWHQSALVLGTGGASKAIVFVLEKLGMKCTLVSRHEEIGLLYEDLDKAMMRSHQVIINCTPLGMFPDVHTFPPIPYQYITDLHLAFDLIYTPAETLFLQYARQNGAATINGLEMLQLQAEKAWEIWNRLD
jgi:shikimate dehydrogenase